MTLKGIKAILMILFVSLVYNCANYVNPPNIPPYPPGGSSRGLKNIGNSCYINSVLQILASLDYYEGIFDYNGPEDNLKKLATLGKDIINSLKKGIKVDKSKLNDFRTLLASNGWDKGLGQQDAQEFLGHIINLMGNTSRFIISTPQYVDENRNYTFSTKLSDTTSYFLPIAVDNASEHIQNLMDNYFRAEVIKWGNYDYGSKNKLAEPYNIIPIQLTFKYNNNNNNNNDLSESVKVNNIKDFASFEISPDKIVSGLGTNPVLYNLVAFIAHHGSSLDSGHYTAFIKEADDEWYHYDDNYVNKIPENSINDYAKSVYLLFYKKNI